MDSACPTRSAILVAPRELQLFTNCEFDFTKCNFQTLVGDTAQKIEGSGTTLRIFDASKLLCIYRFNFTTKPAVSYNIDTE